MVLTTLIKFLFIEPTFWLALKLIQLFVIALLVTIVYRIFVTRFIFWLPESNWCRRKQLKPVQANQLVLITGATSGIGLALAKYLHKLGYSVAAGYWAKANEPGLVELQKISQSNSSVSNKLFLVELDVRSVDSISVAYEQIVQILAQHKLELFALVNNAGLGSLQPFAWLQRDSMVNLIETNLIGNILMAREFIPLLASSAKKRKFDTTSRLLFVSSGLGFVPGPTYATYGVTKSSQIYLTKCLNLELKQRYGVQSVAMIPHNFIKNTNICSHNVKNNKAAWNEMKQIERELFAEEFDQHSKLVSSLEQATRDLSEQQKKTKNRTSSIESTDFLTKFVNLSKGVITSFKGQNLALTIEESGALQNFELALRLRDPPEIIFAGDTAFQLIVGSLLLILPVSLNVILSGSVAPNLYR